MPIRAVASIPLLASTAALFGYVAFRFYDQFRGRQALPKRSATLANAAAADVARYILPAEERAGARTEAEALSDSQWLLDEPDVDFAAASELPLSVDLDAAGDELEPASPEALGANWLLRATESSSPPAHEAHEMLSRNVAAEIVGQSLAAALSAPPEGEQDEDALLLVNTPED